MTCYSRRHFLAALACLPVAVKVFVTPSPAAVAEFQAVTPKTLLSGGTWWLNGHQLRWDATTAEVQKAIGHDCIITQVGSTYTIEAADIRPLSERYVL